MTTTSFRADRRRFLKSSAVATGGLVIGFYLPLAKLTYAAATTAKPVHPPNAFIRIAADETVTILINKSEMGQGVYTSLAMLIAEELECDWSKVRAESAPVAPVYNHTEWGVQGTGGSSSVSSSWDQLRTVGAKARAMLIAAAAQVWQVDVSTCHAENGEVIHDATGRKLTYGALAEKANALPLPETVTLKPTAEFKLIGKSIRRLDSAEKVDGKAQFSLDVYLPDMLTVLIARPPEFGGTVKRFNPDRAKAVPGVIDVVQVPTGVAVAASGYWPAKLGRDALEIEWNDGATAGLSTETLRNRFRLLAHQDGTVARSEGRPPWQLDKDVAQHLVAEYEVPYLAHACMEPLNCVVDLRVESCEIWVGTQLQTIDRDRAAAIAGLRTEQVQIHTTLLGGGFGRRANPQSDFVVEAVQVAKAVGKPVKVVWTREDDMRGGYYRPMWYSRLEGAIDNSGNVARWVHTIVGQSIAAGTPFENALVRNGVDITSIEGAADLPYAIPNIHVDLHSPKLGVPVQWWRSVGHSHTAFVTECFLDELARAADRDPFELRRTLLGNAPRHRAVLELAAEKAGWGVPPAAGRARGIAVHSSFGSYVAQVAEVSLEKGALRVHRVVCAIDCGIVVNPDTVAAQMESGIVFGLTAALHGEITFKDGRIEQSNFDTYPLLRINEMPAVEVYIVPSSESPSGVGEPGVPPIAPAVANALFALTGVPVRRLPIRLDAAA